jgi:RimJ/RimL family protein N-acetyltransferase
MITIRPIAEADIPSFHAALEAVCRERIYLAMLEAPPLDAAQAFILGNLKREVPQFVAVEDGRVVGWCDTMPGDPNQGTAQIGRLGMGVIQSHRGRGLGRRLAEATLQRARERGFEKIELGVFSSNAVAIALYQKLGFVEEGRKRRARKVDGTYDDLVLMALFFSQPAP